MLSWITRGLRKGRVTTRYPRSDSPVGVPPQNTAPVTMRDGFVPLARQSRALRRSVHVRHIDTGSDGAEEWEVQALWSPYYDIQRLGFFLTSSPRHADILLVTGAVTAPMRAALVLTWELMPEPKALVAGGDDACGLGLFAADRDANPHLTAGGVEAVLGVDVYVPGLPPTPVAIIDGLLAAVGRRDVPARSAA